MRKLAIAFALVLLLGAEGLQAQDAAAMIVRVSGTVNVVAGDASPVAAAAGTRLAVGDQVLPDGGQALVAFASGSTQRVTEALTIASAQTGGATGGTFSRAIGVMASAATSDARSRPNRQGMIRPVPGEPVLASWAAGAVRAV